MPAFKGYPTMSVGQLIEELSRFDPEAAALSCWEGAVHGVFQIQRMDDVGGDWSVKYASSPLLIVDWGYKQ